jgi:signal transduction histidine kinase
MAIHTLFDEEEAMISMATDIQNDNCNTGNPLLPHFNTLLAAYTKLNKQQKRIIRLSDKQHGKLSVLNNEMRHILDHVPMGILTIGPNGRINPSFSRFVKSLFFRTKKIDGASLESVLYWEDDREKERDSLRQWLALVFDLAYDWDLIGDLAPEMIEHDSDQGRLYYRHSFHRVIHENGELNLLVTILDVSERMRQKIALAEQETAHNFEMEVLALVVNANNPAELIDVMDDTQRMLEAARSGFDTLAAAEDRLPIYHHLFRLMHSIKGQARSYGMNEFGRLAHAAEDILSQYRSNEITFATGMIDGVLASDRLRDLIDTMTELLLSSDAVVQKVFNRNREHAAAIRNRRRNIKIDEDKFRLVIKQIEALKPLSSDPERLTPAIDDLGEALYRMTLQPLDVAYNRFHNIVADVSRSLEKQAVLSTEGDPVLLDPEAHHQIITALIHLLRNALDHGIEAPELREERGKDSMGKIHLRTMRKGETFVIEFSEDGAGIDPDQIAAIAVRKGLVTEKDILGMDGSQKTALILLPGFSARDHVTDLSGRGVGMDSVADAMKTLNGDLAIDSEPGRGTRFRLTFPVSRRLYQG